MADPLELVVVHTAPNQTAAANVAGLLEAAGIPVWVEGRALQDEFALSQQLLRIGSTAVKVARERLDEARRLIAEALAAGRLLEWDLAEAGPADPEEAEDPLP